MPTQYRRVARTSQPIASLKALYQELFKKEPTGVAHLALYKAASFIAGLCYSSKYAKELKITRDFVKKTKRTVKSKQKSVFVFANGPSLQDIDLSKISFLCDTGKFDLIAINSFLSKSAEQVMPTYAVFADNLHFAKNDARTQYNMDVDICKEHDIAYFVPAKYYAETSGNRLAYCGFCNIYSENTSNILKPAGYYGMTAFFALSIAKTLGYDRIYICGFDNTYFRDFELNDADQMVIRHKHYYDSAEDVTDVPCRYDTTTDFFFDVYRHFYYLQKIAGKKPGIYNVAKKTYINFIPRDVGLDIYKV